MLNRDHNTAHQLGTLSETAATSSSQGSSAVGAVLL